MQLGNTKCNNCNVVLKEGDDVIPISFDKNKFRHLKCNTQYDFIEGYAKTQTGDDI